MLSDLLSRPCQVPCFVPNSQLSTRQDLELLILKSATLKYVISFLSVLWPFHPPFPAHGWCPFSDGLMVAELIPEVL